jgi:uncharacterized protein YqhQ
LSVYLLYLLSVEVFIYQLIPTSWLAPRVVDTAVVVLLIVSTLT